MTIDPDSPEHPYVQLAAILRARIQAGEIAGRLPSLTELTEEYNVSQGVASRAIRRLVDEGLVETAPGRGTFVRRDEPREDLTRGTRWLRPGRDGDSPDQR